jgi:hypothetical protein
VLTPKNGQRFLGETGAIMSGAKVLIGATGSNPWVYSSQTQEGSVGTQLCMIGHDRCVRPEDLFLDNVMLEHVATVGEGASGKWFFDYTADEIKIWDNPAGKVVETSVTPIAFDGSSVTGVIISGLIIEKYATVSSGAVRLHTGWILQDSEVHLNHCAGVTTNGGSIARRNHVHHNGGYSFTGTGSTILVEDNEVNHNNVAFFDAGWGASSKWVFTDGLTVSGNYVHHNYGNGLWTDISNINTIYEDNIVEYNELAGIFHEISYAAIIRRNTCRYNGTNLPTWYSGQVAGSGILVVDSPNVQVYDNVAYSNRGGIAGVEDGRGTDPVTNPDETNGTWKLENFDVHDNVITMIHAQAQSGIVQFTVTNDLCFTSRNNHFGDNEYHLVPSSSSFYWDDGARNETAW